VAALFSFGINLIVPIRALQMKAALHGTGQAGSIASVMAQNSSIGAAVEFMLNPIIGQLSDNFGRKPFIVGCCAATGLIHALVLALPRSVAVNSINRMFTAVTIACFFTTLRAALSDIVSGTALAQAASEQSAWISLGAILSPIVGGKLGPLPSFVTSAVCCEASAFYFCVNGAETQKQGERRAITFERCNPLRFLQLFSSSDPVLSALVAAGGLQSVGDFNGIYDMTSSFLTQHLQWGSDRLGRFWTLDALGGVSSGLMAHHSIDVLGPRKHTTLSNICFALGLCAIGTARSPMGVGIGVLGMTLGRQRDAAIDSAIVDRGQVSRPQVCQLN
jgi:DHA1 family tetracycline resistance protein-like MFS transporter